MRYDPLVMSKANTRPRSWSQVRRVRSVIHRLRDDAARLADEIGELAEPPLREFESADRLAALLAAHGFRVTRPYRKMPTAFKAVRGAGTPAIGVLAEYDALPDCGEKPGQWGHGCGHNLLGVGAAVAGIAAAEVLEALGKPGRVIVFGCPAEEALHGKVFMAAQGAFRGLDAVVAWHPGGSTLVGGKGGAAMDSLRFRFRGKTAHAAGAPHEGRSALDAALLTDVAVNFLREHVKENARIHSVISDGGAAPNVVPDRAEIWYYLRGCDRKQVDDIRRRVCLCARGAATATETRWRMVVETSITERIPNDAIAGLMDELLRRHGGPKFTDAENRQARKLFGGEGYRSGVKEPQQEAGRASSDEDNVSWFAPLGRISVACVPDGVTGHHRSYARACRLPAARKGMFVAAEVMAMTAVELAINAPLRRKAKEEFRKNRAGRKYDLPIPDVAPPVVYGRKG